MSSLLHTTGNMSEMTLTELQEIAMRQQQQIESNHQLLIAKEKRLKTLKQEEAKHQQLSMLTQQSSQIHHKTDNFNKLESLKQNVLGQELKIFKLKQLRNQILECKISNSNMNSELDLIKNLFDQKERELYGAANKVNELSKQIDQLRKIKQQGSKTAQVSQSQSPLNSVTELERLKQELQIRNKLNEQQSKKIIQQHEMFNKKQIEVVQLDKRIDELRQRISAKRNKLNPPAQESDVVLTQPSRKDSNEKPVQSPSKQVAKFATKQEIANTYMNKYGSEAYQKYQAQSMRLMNQPTQAPFIQINDDETESSSASQGSLPSSSSSLISLSPMANTNTPTCQTQQQQEHHLHQQQQHANDQSKSSDLPSHLRLEFDKLKYLPDVVKTIKKRHSISEIESSSTMAPQIYQKMMEKHHNNNLKSNQNDQILQQQQLQQQQQIRSTSGQQKLSKILENPSDNSSSNSSFNSTSLNLNTKSDLFSVDPSNSTLNFDWENTNKNSQPKLTTFMPNLSKDKPKDIATESQQTEVEAQKTQKSTKSIIKITNNQGEPVEPNSTRRVNFDPHALLLDAAVEGELDLVKKCARQVKDISEPNDEGITALHNSVCAGHFDIVRFLVEYGCDINYADNDGWTPLHCAASCNNIQMIKFLIENGASVFATTISDNETAIKKCEEDEEGYQVCFDYLMSAQLNLGSKEFNNGQVHALYSYEAVEGDELTFNCFDRLVLVDRNENEGNGDANDGWWTCKLADDGNRQGLVPKNYIGLYPRVKGGVFKNQEESTVC